MPSKNTIKKISLLLIASGTFLTLLNLLGLVISPSMLDETLHDNRKVNGIAGYTFQSHDISRLRDMLEKPVANFDLESVNNEIYGAIIHTDQRRIQPYENWLLWIAGKIYEPLSNTQDPARIVSGEGALCSEVSAVMNHIATLNGHKARLIRLNGHVVSEVLTHTGWRVADPDYGVTYPASLNVLESDEGTLLISQALQSRGYKKDKIARYTKLFQSTEDNKVLSIGIGGEMSPRLHLIETRSEIFKWFIPLLIIILGLKGLGKTADLDAYDKIKQ